MKICKHNDGLGRCGISGEYCVEGPCHCEELIEYEPVRHGPCPYCDAETNDFVPINQSVEYSGIEIALNRQGMLRVRVYESGQETFTTQDIVEIKYCPNCGCKMDKGE